MGHLRKSFYTKFKVILSVISSQNNQKLLTGAPAE